MGMEGSARQTTRAPTREPHACGDGRRGHVDGHPRCAGAPRVWGWKASKSSLVTLRFGSPTRVGMEGWRAVVSVVLSREPHVRGDGRHAAENEEARLRRAPRAWGWKWARARRSAAACESPTCVGMEGWRAVVSVVLSREPHVRGDGRTKASSDFAVLVRAPRAWGWKAGSLGSRRVAVESPTCVGMEGRSGSAATPTGREPHVRGDGRFTLTYVDSAGKRAPRAWGWLAPTEDCLSPTDSICQSQQTGSTRS